MLCPSCRRRLDPRSGYCPGCGRSQRGGAEPLELVLPDATRVPLVGDLTIGRAADSSVRLEDPSVSRRHARIFPNGGGSPVLEDAGSSHGTWLDGVRVTGRAPLRDGACIRMGELELLVERRRHEAEAGRTIVVRPGASLLVPAAGEAGVAAGEAGVAAGAALYATHPRVRSGYALKRLEASEGSRRWVLRDLTGGSYLRLSDNDAELFRRLDGSASLADLISEAERRFGPTGPARVARLLADLGERGILSGVAGAAASGARGEDALRRVLRPRERCLGGADRLLLWLYGRAGWVLFTRPVTIGLVAFALAGLVVFAVLVVADYGTPFVVADHLGWGGLVFVLGRFAVVAVHEVAHGLTMVSFGRHVERAGLKLVLVFPYAFLDTSEAWFEPRRRRIAVSAAGPLSDLVLGAAFGVVCFVVGGGTVGDVFLQLAFAAYVGALFNLNPFVDRDGYHILVDLLREPGLRRRAQEQLARRLSGRRGPGEHDSPVLARYSLVALAWSVIAAGGGAYLTLRYESVMRALAPDAVVWIVLATVWLALFVPVVLVVGRPLVMRLRGA